ncbi:MAG: hypothetical protein QM482_01880 [Sulfurospirillum sp.]
MSKFSYFYLIGDFFIIILALLMGKYWLLNTQVAFICSMFITFASFYAYKKSIQKGIKNSNGEEFRDSFDELEDPYNLFDNEDEKPNQPKKNRGVFKYTVKGFASGIAGAVNPLRILAYIVLIVSFLYLNRQGLFNGFAFFTGLSIVPIMSMLSSIINLKSKQS